jgi:hypothetical protein
MKKTTQKQNKNGFIALFFILGISFTFLTWISLSSERVFEYTHIKTEFIKNRTILQNHILCSDAFMNILIGSRYNLSFKDQSYGFDRNLYFADNHKCEIENISITFDNDTGFKHIFFISGDYSFEYKLKNGFVNFSKSFRLL